MESKRGHFIIIDFEQEKAIQTFNKLKQTKSKVSVIHNKKQVDDIYHNEGIIAFLVSPNISEDIPRLKKDYRSPIFIIGDVDTEQLETLYKKEVEDILPYDFQLSTLFNQLNMSEELYKSGVKTSLYSISNHSDEPLFDEIEEYEDKKGKRKKKGSLFATIKRIFTTPLFSKN